MRCANNNGINNTWASGGYQEETCGVNYVLKSTVDNPPEDLMCSGIACSTQDCCELTKCTNNLGTPNHHIRKEANGWGWRDVCNIGYQPLTPFDMPRKMCTNGGDNCLHGDCCDVVKCVNNDGANKTSVNGNGANGVINFN
jgi:hypothetical protein